MPLEVVLAIMFDGKKSRSDRISAARVVDEYIGDLQIVRMRNSATKSIMELTEQFVRSEYEEVWQKHTVGRYIDQQHDLVEWLKGKKVHHLSREGMIPALKVHVTVFRGFVLSTGTVHFTLKRKGAYLEIDRAWRARYKTLLELLPR